MKRQDPFFYIDTALLFTPPYCTAKIRHEKGKAAWEVGYKGMEAGAAAHNDFKLYPESIQAPYVA